MKLLNCKFHFSIFLSIYRIISLKRNVLFNLIFFLFFDYDIEIFYIKIHVIFFDLEIFLIFIMIICEFYYYLMFLFDDLDDLIIQ